MTLAGVDGCKGGWVVAESDGLLSTVQFWIAQTFAEIVSAYSTGPAIVIVDIPIGLAADCPRACDQAARALLGSPRSNSVFSAPCRSVLEATTYFDACQLSRLARGKAISQQCFGILPKIREVDNAMSPSVQQWVREAHPEVTFAVLADDRHGLAASKKEPTGMQHRLELLAKILPEVNPVSEVQRLRPARVHSDDVVDALACLATAHRLSKGLEVLLPAGVVERDAQGLRMEIVA